MAEKTVVQWQSSYSVGMKLIDEQHMELINLTNKLFSNCLAGQENTRAAFLQVIREVVDYVSYHFSTEEKIMERVEYPGFAIHKQQHGDFIREVISKVDDFNAGKPRAPLAFVYFLRDWVLHHVAVSDKKVGNFVMSMWKSGELQKITMKVKKDEVSDRMEIQ